MAFEVKITDTKVRPNIGFFVIDLRDLIDFLWSLVVRHNMAPRVVRAWAKHRGTRSVVCSVGRRCVSSTEWFMLSVEELVTLKAMTREPRLGVECKDQLLIESSTLTPKKGTPPLAYIVSPKSLRYLVI